MPSRNQLPALLGGTPVRPAGPPPWPLPDPDVLEALQAAYANGSWGKYHGPHVPGLEERLRAYHGVAFALTCASGTFAVELALRALKIGPGDEVIMAAYDYSGNFLTVHAVGAQPVLVDVAPHNWSLVPYRLAEAVSPATRAVIVSHLHGGIVPMREVMAVAAEHCLQVIEDAAQAPGALIQGVRAGSWGDVGILSFGGSKLLTAGRGGVLLTQRPDVYQRARRFCHRGNLTCPLSELQAAVLLPQLDKLDARNAQRSRNVELLADRLRDVPGLRMFANEGSESTAAYYKVGFQYDATTFGLSRDQFLRAMAAEGIAIDAGFTALHMGRSPRRFRWGSAPDKDRLIGALVEAERASWGCVVLHHPVLLGPPDGVEEIAAAVHKVWDHRAELAGK